MASSNKHKTNRGNGIKLATVIGETAITLVPVLDKLIGTASNQISLVSKQKEFEIIPPLYTREESISLNRAVEILTRYGFQPEPVELYIRDAKLEYRDYFDTQVVDPRFMHPQKLKLGKPVILHYITQEVIDESQRLFDVYEKGKADAKRIKAEKSKRAKLSFKKILPNRKYEDKK